MMRWECGSVLTRVEARAGVRRGTRSPVLSAVQCQLPHTDTIVATDSRASNA